jgi:Undecaprenyl-phosphate galactose phosphotransferase WbaP
VPARATTWMLFYTFDFFAILLSLHVGTALGNFVNKGHFGVPNLFSPQAFGAWLLCMPLVYAALGLYPGYGLSPADRSRLQTSGTAIIFGILALCVLLRFRSAVPLIGLPIALVVALATQPLISDVLIRFRRLRSAVGAPTAVVGTEADCRRLIATLLERRDSGLVPVLAVVGDQSSPGVSLQVPTFASGEDAREAVRQVRAFVIASNDASARRFTDIVRFRTDARVFVVPHYTDIQGARVAPRELGGQLFLEVQFALYRRRDIVLKRAFDVVGASVGLLMAAPIIGLSALLVKLIDPGPVFYVQERVGQFGETIRILKIRTMHADAEQRLNALLEQDEGARQEWQRYCKLRRDPRVVPWIGALLRRYSLDELPQLWNVLVGDMSLVGPRPFPKYHLDLFSPEFRELRQHVKPGITGFWQVEARSNGDLAMQESLDRYYLRNWSLWLDNYILVRTVVAVLGGVGAR